MFISIYLSLIKIYTHVDLFAFHTDIFRKKYIGDTYGVRMARQISEMIEQTNKNQNYTLRQQR